MKKQSGGITLISLVITIIILLILAGISIAQLTGSGLFENAKLAKEKSEEAQKLENSILSDYSNKIDNYINNTTRELENEKEMKFYKGNNGFNVTHGEMAFNSYGLKTTTFPTDNIVGDGYYAAECEKIENATLDSEFEISAQIYFNNETLVDIGSIVIELFKNDEIKCSINIKDDWYDTNTIQMSAELGTNTIGSVQKNRYNGSGRYAIVGDGEKVHFYWGEMLLGSIDYTENISYDKIVIKFQKYNTYSVPPIYLESLYIGEPLYYKSVIQ